jgi:hypothetical protein
MEKIKKWLKNQIVRVMFSVSNVEKNALGQSGESLESDVSKVKRHTQGQLADSLINGEVTQEVFK